MVYKFDVPDNNAILDKILELKTLKINIDRHIRVLQAAHIHIDIESGGDQRDGYWKRCKHCGASL